VENVAASISGETLAMMIAETHAATEQVREDTEAVRNLLNFLVSAAALLFYAWLLWSYRGTIGRLLTGWAAE